MKLPRSSVRRLRFESVPERVESFRTPPIPCCAVIRSTCNAASYSTELSILPPTPASSLRSASFLHCCHRFQFSTNRYSSPLAPVNSMCCLPSSMNVSGGLDRPPICEYHSPLPVAASAGLDVRPVAQEEQAARGRQQPGAAAVDLLPPRDLAGLVVDGDDVRAPVEIAAAAGAAQAHRSARIGLHQVADAHRVLLVHVEQPGVRRERRRRIVQDVAVHERAGDGGVLVRIALRLALRVEARRPVVDEAELAGQRDARRWCGRARRSSRCASPSSPACACAR